MVALYVKRGEQIFGPFSIEQLKTDAQNGRVKSGDAISQSTDGPWTQVEQVKGLVLKGAAAVIVQPTLPPAGPDPSAVDPPGNPVSPITPLPAVDAKQAQGQQQVSDTNKTVMNITAVFHRWFLHGNRKIFSAIGLIVIVGLLILSFFVNQANNRTANENLDKFSQKMRAIENVFKGFEDGTVTAKATINTLNNSVEMRSDWSDEISAQKRTGSFLGIGIGGFWGTDQQVIRVADREWVTWYSRIVDLIPRIVSQAGNDILERIRPLKGETKEETIEKTVKEFIDTLGGVERARALALKMGTTLHYLKIDFQGDAKGN